MASTITLVESEWDVLFDKPSGEPISIRAFTFSNKNRLEVVLITYGATIVSVRYPDSHGEMDDVVMGFDNVGAYSSELNPYFGGLVGRCANNIGFGKVNIGGKVYQVSKNAGDHHFNGGFIGFNKVIWEHHVHGKKVMLSYVALDDEEGYPGSVLVNASFELTEDNRFIMDWKATTTKPTVINLTNSSHFNLAGHNKGPEELYKHLLIISADTITETDADGIPTGRLIPVKNSVYDLNFPKFIGDVINKIPGPGGFNHNYCITRNTIQLTAFVARLHHVDSGRVLKIYSNQPGVQFYTGNELPEDNTIFGKDATSYMKRGALCLASQNWPDAPNHSNFPSAKLNPGETYQHLTIFKFKTQSRKFSARSSAVQQQTNI